MSTSKSERERDREHEKNDIPGIKGYTKFVGAKAILHTLSIQHIEMFSIFGTCMELGSTHKITKRGMKENK